MLVNPVHSSRKKSVVLTPTTQSSDSQYDNQGQSPESNQNRLATPHYDIKKRKLQTPKKEEFTVIGTVQLAAASRALKREVKKVEESWCGKRKQRSHLS